jgi:RimJ/RimL family protein N-acetyltransferase
MKLIGRILYGADREVAAMVASRIPSVGDKGFGDCTALGVVVDGELVGGVVFTAFSGHDVHVHMAFDSPRWATPQTLRELYAYPFGQLGCVRMTAPIGRKNKRMRRLAEGLGFKLEGVMKRGLDGKEDLMIFGTLRDECRWLKGNS